MTLIAISADPVEELASWARDADFPFLFASADAETFRAFGAGVRDNGMPGSRMVAVVDPDGRVAFTASPFREIDPTAYDELRAAVEAVAPPLEAEGEGGDGDLDEALETLLGGGDC